MKKQIFLIIALIVVIIATYVYAQIDSIKRFYRGYQQTFSTGDRIVVLINPQSFVVGGGTKPIDITVPASMDGATGNIIAQGKKIE